MIFGGFFLEQKYSYKFEEDLLVGQNGSVHQVEIVFLIYEII